MRARATALLLAGMSLLTLSSYGCGGQPSHLPDAAVDAETPPVCGDGLCELDRGEHPEGCPADCTFECGNGRCEYAHGERLSSCVEDCGWEVIDVGGFHTCAIRFDGTAWCWGNNRYGQLGTGSPDGPEQCDGRPCATVPLQVAELEDVVSISAGTDYTCAAKADGTAWCWACREVAVA